MRFGILTGGGDAPGLNGIIEAAATTLLRAGHEVIGIHDGFEGVFEGRHKKILIEEITGLHAEAGTFVGTSNKSRIDGRVKEFLDKYLALKLDGLIVAGGDGTFAALSHLGQNIPIVGVPKTIDNDLQGTDVTFGYDTACTVVADAVDALRATAEAHRRIMIIETMGRTAGWIALGGGLASYADVILVPERPFEKKTLLNYLQKKRSEGRRGLVIVCTESATAIGEEPLVAFELPDSPQSARYGGIAEKMARWIEKEIAWEARHTVLGHLQRSRAPTTTDRFLTLSMGVKAAQAALENQWNQAVVFREGRIQLTPLSDLQGPARTIPQDHRWIKLCQAIGIFV